MHSMIEQTRHKSSRLDARIEWNNNTDAFSIDLRL